MVKIFSIFIYCLLALTTSFNYVHAEVLYMWSQLMPEHMLSVRTISNDTSCPNAYVNGKKITMLSRSESLYGNSVEVEKVCELAVHKNVKNITINGIRMPALKKKINKIAFIGDTGCRVTTLMQQECNSNDAWPLQDNLNSISLHNPDFIVHVGDYVYRESACRNEAKCGNIHGYNNKTWYADWFESTKDISHKQPFLFIRGNHEDCRRAYDGWFKYINPYPIKSDKCEDFIKSWFFDVGPIKFFNFDSSYIGTDLIASSDNINTANRKFDMLLQDDTNKPIWFLTHRPLWHLPKRKFLIFADNGSKLQVESFADKFPNNVSAIVSGHVHIAQVLLMNDVPDQIIVGNGGALLHAQDQEQTYSNVNFHCNDKTYTACKVQSFFGFGFAILDLKEHKLTFYSKDNNELSSLRLTKDFKIIKPT